MKRVFPWLSAVGLLLTNASARAHDPAKVLQYVSTKADDVIIGTNRGLIFGNLASRDFRLLCNEVYDASTNETGIRFAELEGGRLLVVSSDGLKLSDDRGCTWLKSTALGELSVPSLATTAAGAVFVTTYTQDAPFSGTVRVSRDRGESFTTLHTGLDEYLRTLLIVDTDPPRIYVAGMLLAATSVSHFIARSSDSGATWERNDVPLEKDEIDLTLLAFNPKEPLELLARASNSEPAFGERLLWSTDGGRTFRSLGKVVKLQHAAFLADGSGAFVSGTDGLLRVAGPMNERRLEPMPVANTANISQILPTPEGDLLIGGAYKGLDSLVDGVGVGRAPTFRFERWFDFREVDEQVKCGGSEPSVCRQLWVDWANENLGGAGDAGISDAGASLADAGRGPDAAVAPLDAGRPQSDASAPRADASTREDDDAPGAESSKYDGCQLVHSGPVRQGLPWLILASVALLRRRRRSS